MSAKPRFKPIMMELRGPDGHLYKTRVTDARDLTAEKAVEKVLQKVYSVHDSQTFIEHLARLVGMQAYLADGKVRVRRAKK